jgi:dTDP-4-dehydrorhamnose reductase
MTRWLVTGAAGMLGREVVSALDSSGEEVAGLTRRDLDIADRAAVAAALRRWRPDVVVNCAAWTAVDDAESHEDEALRVNGRGAGLLAAGCAASGARLVQVSTDYVFSGIATVPYGEYDPPAPQTAYGRTKLAGERAVLRALPHDGYVVRTAWLYGAHGANFVRTIIRLEREQPVLQVVNDQRGQPTWAADAADQILRLIRSGAPAGIYHATSSGETSWHGLARAIFRLLGADDARVKPVSTSEYPRPARRPGNSVLGHGAWAAAGVKPIGDWHHGLERAFARLISA